MIFHGKVLLPVAADVAGRVTPAVAVALPADTELTLTDNQTPTDDLTWVRVT